MGLFRQTRNEDADHSSPSLATLSLQIDGLIAHIGTIRLELVALRVAVNELNGVREMLESRSLVAYQARKAGRVAGGVARAATARRDALGRYVS